MRLARTLLAVLLSFVLTCPAWSQQAATTSSQSPPQRDTQAVAVLNQMLSTSGGSNLISSIQDSTATGSITYFWGGQQVQGTVTLRQKGADEFRLDANLPSGVRSWAVSFGNGSVIETDGAVRPVGFANALNLGALAFPLAEVYADLQDSSTTLTYVGSTQIAGRTAAQIRAQRNFGTLNDADGSLSKLRSRDFFIDSSNLQLLLIRDTTHSSESVSENYQHEIWFSDYRLVNGVLVPFGVSEKIAGQQTWAVQLAQITFNNNLSDADFQL